MWFSYDPEDGFEEHGTEAGAKQRVEICLESCRDVAENGELPWDANRICWGKIHGHGVIRIKSIDSDGVVDFVMDTIKPE